MGSYRELQEEKKSRAWLLYENGLPVGRIAKILSLSRTTVYSWIANFAEEKENNMSVRKRNSRRNIAPARERAGQAIPAKPGKAGGQSTPPMEQESAEEKIARLEKELREARLRADFYDEMINVAEKKFDIQIRKKAGARQ